MNDTLKALKTYIDETIGEKDKYFKSNIEIISTGTSASTKYQLLITLGEIINTGKEYRDLSEEGCFIDYNNIFSHLLKRINKETELLSKLMRSAVYQTVQNKITKAIYRITGETIHDINNKEYIVLIEQNNTKKIIEISKYKSDFIEYKG